MHVNPLTSPPPAKRNNRCQKLDLQMSTTQVDSKIEELMAGHLNRMEQQNEQLFEKTEQQNEQ